MYAIYGNIDHQQKTQMLADIPYMDPMGLVFLDLSNGGLKLFSCLNYIHSSSIYDNPTKIMVNGCTNSLPPPSR